MEEVEKRKRRKCSLLEEEPVAAFTPTHSDGFTLLRRSVRRHRPLPHDVVALVNLAHHAHGVLLSLVVWPGTTGGHVVLLGGGLLVHHGP